MGKVGGATSNKSASGGNNATSRAPETSRRPESRPTGLSATARAPETSKRPESRPDRVEVSPDAATDDSAAVDSLVSGLSSNFTSSDGDRIAGAAEEWAGREFKPGETARCADFVSSVIEQSGVNAPGFEPTVRARDFGEMGQSIDPENMQPGDVVAFNNTYRWSANDQDHTHVGVYVGDGQMVHRPTADAPVERVALDEYLARPTSGNIPDRSLAGVYRMTEESPTMLASN